MSMRIPHPLWLLSLALLGGTLSCVNNPTTSQDRDDTDETSTTDDADGSTSDSDQDADDEGTSNDNSDDASDDDTTLPERDCLPFVGGITPSPSGTDSGVEMASWNIKNYPSEGPETQRRVEEAIIESEIDFFALQEVTSESVFEDLLGCLVEYSGVVSSHSYNREWDDQKPAFIYRTERFALVDTYLFPETSSFSFPRPVLVVQGDLLNEDGETVQRVNFYNVHLKSGFDEESQERREAGSFELAQHVSAHIQANPTQGHIVMGDFNAQPSTTGSSPIYSWFEDDLRVVTGVNGIDHILVDTAFEETLSHESSSIMNLPVEIDGYYELVSDHEPMVSLFEIKADVNEAPEPTEDDDDTIAEICDDGFDNDGNGFSDCEDFACTRDSSGDIDRSLAPHCFSEIQASEDTASACTDGIDNNWNGYFDCADWSCQHPGTGCPYESTQDTCSDGIDNNGDDLIDCDSPTCSAYC